ncbi:hypothetical protein [Aquibacillus salsiterrae]|uniref:Uncharacterized protein n=1 Tax=Aquibacillus salsiterrae TaxID=2950439 RepID=A0A9X3WE89_9BACI|nr:hypothetical protein [Aquibacillus salsiterrae]MDC3415456.1 hypothetical protein [Aquibacillus salsiterrae]
MKKKKIRNYTSVGTVDPRGIEHQITYPGQKEFNLRNVSYSPGENDYLNENGDQATER